MAEAKTKPTKASVSGFLSKVEASRRKDCQEILKMMEEATGEKPTMWGPSMVGFGSYHYRYASGHEGDCFVVGFSPRKDSLTLYITSEFEAYSELMAKLGKYRTGKSCLYIKKLDDIDRTVLRTLIKKAVARTRRYGLAHEAAAR
jgi:hypothetical protein